jgi:hypothetical protein
MSKNNTKSIQLDPEVHDRLKQYCDLNGLKLQIFVENLIISKIGTNQSVKEKIKEKIKNKVKTWKTKKL